MVLEDAFEKCVLSTNGSQWLPWSQSSFKICSKYWSQTHCDHDTRAELWAEVIVNQSLERGIFLHNEDKLGRRHNIWKVRRSGTHNASHNGCGCVSQRSQEQETITEQWGSERLRNHVLISQKDTFNSGNIGRHRDSLKMKYRNIRRLSVYGSSMKKKKQMIWRQKAHGVLLEWNVSRCT